MNRAFGLTMFLAGVVLLISGLYLSQSLGEELERVLRNGVAERSVWLVSAGMFSVLAGLFLVFRSRRESA